MKIRFSTVLFCLAMATQEKANASQGNAAVFGVFIGSTPCDSTIRSLLQIPADMAPDMIRWKLTLRQEPKTFAPAGYELYCEYGPGVGRERGLQNEAMTLKRQGHWRMTEGTNSSPGPAVLELDAGVSFLKLDNNVLHVLNRDRGLMVGGTGWSYTLYRAEASEPPADADEHAAQPPEGSYTLPPIVTGPAVLGVFGGRSPCQRIALQLELDGVTGCARIKWRITLYQDPQTRMPTTYQVHNSLLRQAAREGKWTIVRGTASDPHAVIYRLEPTKTGAALFLLKGDDNVLFFLDKSMQPLVGNADFSYTLNRKPSSR